MTRIEIIAILVLIAGVAAGAALAVHTYNSAIERADKAANDLKQSQANVKTLESANADQRVENATLRAKQELFDAIQKDRAASNSKIAGLQRSIDAKIATIIATSPKARAWSAEPVPAEFLDSVREQAGAADSKDGHPDARTAAPSVDNSNAGSGVAGANDKRAVIRPRAPSAASAQSVQR
jgi:hypothetical protein